jgi:hypothetical protein
MSTSRTFVRSSRLFSVAATTSRATRPACLSTRNLTLRRQLATSTRLCQETVDTPSRGQEVPLTSFTKVPAGSHARSIAILSFPKRAVRSEIESLLQSKGFEMYVLLSLARNDQPWGPTRDPRRCCSPSNTLQHKLATTARSFYISERPQMFH